MTINPIICDLPNGSVFISDEPDHDGVCHLEQDYFLRAISDDLDLSNHLKDAMNCLHIVLTADEYFKVRLLG